MINFYKNEFTNPDDLRMFDKARDEGIETFEDRLEKMMPECGFGELGTCCIMCYMGPCRIDPFGDGPRKGVCGASPDVIVARNFLRSAVGGACSHMGHAREVALLLKGIGEGEIKEYSIKDPEKLKRIATAHGISVDGKDINEIAVDVADKALEDFGRQDGQPMNWIKARTTKREYEKLEKNGLVISNPHNEVEVAMHRTSMGNDADPVNLWIATLRMGMVDNYAGLMPATDLQGVIFGIPQPQETMANFGVLEKDSVNIAVHGHSPVLSAKVLEMSEKLESEAKAAGAERINVVGICCTGNELTMRFGIPMAGHETQAELILLTGAVDAMVVDMQCIWPSLTTIASCYDTKFITTIPFVKNPDAIHIEFEPQKAGEKAQEIVKLAIEAFKARKKLKDENVMIPKRTVKGITGLSVEALVGLLSKVNPDDPLAPVIDAIKNGDVFGAVGMVGCPNPKLRYTSMAERMARSLLNKNVLIVTTGCVTHILAQAGFLNSDATEKYCGGKLKGALSALGKAMGFGAPLPPVWHLGSCVDNSRIYDLLAALADKIGVYVSDLPVAGSAPEFITEKAVSIGSFFLGTGVLVHVAPPPRVFGSPVALKILTEELPKITGGKVLVETNPEEAAEGIYKHITEKRSKLGI